MDKGYFSYLPFFGGLLYSGAYPSSTANLAGIALTVTTHRDWIVSLTGTSQASRLVGSDILTSGWAEE